ncbi:MAG: methylated-DNA--[protein]-cysteine S-methyltransferase [Lachnospiraceae bacterium]
MIETTKYRSPIGDCLLAADARGLVGLWFEGQKYGCPIREDMRPDSGNEILADTKLWLDAYFKGQKPGADQIPLMPRGSKFRLTVWKILCEIPYGEIMTYGEIAKIIAEQNGKKAMSAQAVGGAVAHNPISVIIPCHRVIGSDRSLTGYAGGIEKKKWLLEHEHKRQPSLDNIGYIL